MATNGENSCPMGNIKLKYVAIFFMALMAWSSIYAPEAMAFVLTINLITLFFLNIVRFKLLPKASKNWGLSLVQTPLPDPPKVKAIVICDENSSGEKIFKTLRGLRDQDYQNLRVVILKVGAYDEMYQELKRFCEKTPKKFILFRREGPLLYGEAISSCINYGEQDFRAALILSPGLKLDPHVLNQAICSLESKQADYLQYYPYTKNPTVNDIKRLRFYQTYMRAAKTCAAPGIIAPMTLIKKEAIPINGHWTREKSPFLALSMSLIKNGKRGFFESVPCGSGAESTVLDLKQTIYEIKLGDALQIGAPRLVPFTLQLTSHFHFLTAPAIYFSLMAVELISGRRFLPDGDHGAFLAGSAVLLSLYFKLALIYQKHSENMPMKSILKNYIIELGSNFQGAGAISRASNIVFLLASMIIGGALFYSSSNPALLTPVFASALAIVGIGVIMKDKNYFPKRSGRKNISVQTKASRKDKSVWRIEMNSSEA